MLFTNFIIFDLEFNSTKLENSNKSLNEIIEIGAVKLNESLQEIDSFSSFIKPVISKKLNHYVKNLTHISEAELQKADVFSNVIKDFVSWCNANEETVFMTWSDTDLHVLMENYNIILKNDKIDFIEYYADLQKYIQKFITTENNNQISLKSAAEHYNIKTDDFALHRAQDDSRICAELFAKTYDKNVFKSCLRNLKDVDFFKRLLFKPYIISNLKSEGIDKNTLFFDCPICQQNIKFSGKYNPRIKAFSNVIKCGNCKKKIAVTFKFKKTFDGINITKRAKEFIKINKKDKTTVQ